MRIIYLSGLASKAAIEDASRRDPKFSGYAMQKFNRLVAEGMVRNGHKVRALSTFYLPHVGYGYCRRKEIDEGVQYQYIGSPNLSLLRHIWLVLYCFCFILFWGIICKKNKVLVCDVLNISACIGAVAAARLIGLRRVGIMTDMPGMMVNKDNSSTNPPRKRRLSFNTRMNMSYLGRFTHYVFLTEQMNYVVNTGKRPYIVMEGLVDAEMKLPETMEKHSPKIVLYAGGLHERYGLKLLVEGFIQADMPGTELWIYGSGPFADNILEYNKLDSRIIYKGIRPNNEVVEAELQAMLLVNPRPSSEEFTLYSFPSKNMEYMVSGTPLLTTPLPGIPKDHYPYLFFFEEESVDAFARKIKELLSLPDFYLVEKGMQARQFVLSTKNNIIQTKRILSLLND